MEERVFTHPVSGKVCPSVTQVLSDFQQYGEIDRHHIGYAYAHFVAEEAGRLLREFRERGTVTLTRWKKADGVFTKIETDLAFANDDELVEAVVGHLRGWPKAVMSEKADAGTVAHAVIAEFRFGREDPARRVAEIMEEAQGAGTPYRVKDREAVAQNVVRAREWWDRNVEKALDVEARLFSDPEPEDAAYCGAIDELAVLKDGRIVLVDWKTGSKSAFHALQVVAYSRLLESAGFKVDAGLVVCIGDGEQGTYEVDLDRDGGPSRAWDNLVQRWHLLQSEAGWRKKVKL